MGNAEKIMQIDRSILDKYGHMSGVDLEKHEDEFIQAVHSAGITSISQEEADELENQNFHTALGILIKKGFLKKKKNSAPFESKTEKLNRGKEKYGSKDNKSGFDFLREKIKQGKSDEEIIKMTIDPSDPHEWTESQVRSILKDLRAGGDGY